ncbi:hypothetical protein KL86DYS2_10058 [uncultured Dysgonomonas sp.]|uniref:Uncharacterized protein n=1 Tax=uncultured Dysgonomonas sp. TaxID=206096 RepID=A0A212IU66_9BACT|nr:hypothetical protein KL86DYS2_10058 [uncultured Dysgonomonas sp.]
MFAQSILGIPYTQTYYYIEMSGISDLNTQTINFYIYDNKQFT